MALRPEMSTNTKMRTLPPLPSQSPKRLLYLKPKKLSFSTGFSRSQLIKGKDDIDHYLEVNFKGLSKQETAIYRNSHKKNICIEMLKEGYHKSFFEFSSLIQKWNALREAGGPGSAIWLQTSLEEQPHKLDQLHHFLTRAEAAERSEYYEEMYNNLLSLARCFDNSEDKWLRNYFYERCFETAKLIQIDGGRKEAETHAILGHVCEEKRHFKEAAEHYEAFHQLTEGRMWKDEAGRTHNSLACENLWRIYTILADKMLENKQHKPAIKTLIKAFEIAKKGGHRKMEGKAAYCLGLAYHSSNLFDTAVSILNTYIEISTTLDDNIGIGKGYEAIAKVLKSQGKLTEALDYLEKYVKIAESNNECQSVVEGCTMIGDIYSAQGFYDKACESYKKAFDTTENLRIPSLVDEIKVNFGIAKAHQMMATFNRYVEPKDHISLEYLLQWKEKRSDLPADPVTDESLEKAVDRL
ncbi:tetratricopeptide repeat protein 29 [Tachyglossus aculeatus]|uniref:tetratricopeptide repeat protein 29 n=1 Tax=Tachyglossus aculeatus TaxID=9261 RepID=UPI0018F3E272|nr:tetratricopeptide repeat protein 29 [Tachyglossus aculeatus]